LKSIGEVLDQSGGLGKGFGFLRVALAVTIIGWHSLVISQGDRSYFDQRYIWSLNYCLLPMFFGLSGFLIAGSAQRLSVFDFYINRVARIFPALVVETIISAIIIGSVITSLPLGDYLTQLGFFEYFRNMYGAVVYVLPGVTFLPPYSETVNGVIWTVPIELACYLVMGLLIVSGLQRRCGLIIGVGIFLLSIPHLINQFNMPQLSSFFASSHHLSFLNSTRGKTLLPSFLFGVAAYNLRYSIPFSRIVTMLCVAIVIGLGIAGNVSEVFTNFICALVLCVASVGLMLQIGCSNLEKLSPKGDYSYGLYIYCFPFQQIINKGMAIGGPFGFFANFALSLLIAFFFAAFSWTYVEKPVLKLRKRFGLVKKVELSA
jgi:peptidoglycan/LPS O-acetylase OafA/YrhL